jgi:hypothetical protein
MRLDDGEDFVKYWNKDVMKAKLNEFKQIEPMSKNYYDPKTLKYYLPHILKVNKKIDLIIQLQFHGI